MPFIYVIILASIADIPHATLLTQIIPYLIMRMQMDIGSQQKKSGNTWLGEVYIMTNSVIAAVTISKM